MISREDYVMTESAWDSEHFGVNSGKLIFNKEVSKETFDDAMVRCADVDFLTIVNQNNSVGNNYLLGQYSNAFLTDMQVVFSKAVVGHQISEDVQISNNYPANDKILRIVSNNFLYSRFYNDPNISREKADEVYSKWASSAFGKEDKYFAVCSENGVIQGLFLFAFDVAGDLDQGRGFMVVDKAFQGCGVGKKLMTSVEAFAYERGSKLIFGGTQIDNIKMVNHYFKDGYTLSRRNSIYHLWK